MTVSDEPTVRALVASLAKQGDRPTVLAPGRKPLDAAGVLAHVDRVGAALRSAGVARNERVAIVVPNGPEMATSFLAVAAYATAAPLNPAYTAADFEFYLSDLSARVVIVRSGFETPVRDVAASMGIPLLELEVAEDAPAGVFDLVGDGTGAPVADSAPAAADDTALVLHTSGTTSRPKIVPLSHTNVCTSAANIVATLALEPADRCLNVMPLFHIHGLMAAVLSTVRAGGSIVCTPGFAGDGFFEWLGAFEPSWYTAVPTMHQAVLAGADAHRSIIEAANLRFVRSSSASLPPPVMDALEALFSAPVIEAYGMTEAAHQMASNPLPPAEHKAGSVGVAAGPEVAIMNDAGELLEPGATGEIVIRGANVTAGYEANAEANASAFTHGWFRTGDEGVLDAEGYLRITGRLKEMVNRGGEKVVPREIDETLLDHPAVTQAVAFAIPHATLGEDLAAAVVLAVDAQATEAELREFCFDRLVGFKVPSRIVVVDTIPKGPTGKLQRIGLAGQLADALTIGFEAPVGEMEQAVAEVWSDVLGVEVGRHENFFFAGGDSLSAVAAVTRLESMATSAIEPADLFRAPTVAGFAALLAGDAAVPDDGPLVELRAGDGPPVFCIPGHGGDVFTFLELAKRLPGNRPVVAFPYPEDLRSNDPATEFAANGRVTELGEAFAEAARARCPDDPIDIVGFCFGGFIAHEAIARFEADDAPIGAAVYVHAWFLAGAPLTTKTRLLRHLRNPALFARKVVARLRGERLHDDGPDLSNFPEPKKVAAPLTLVRTRAEMDKTRRWAADKGWGPYAPVDSVTDVDGDKRSVFTAAHVDPLVDVVADALDVRR